VTKPDKDKVQSLRTLMAENARSCAAVLGKLSSMSSNRYSILGWVGMIGKLSARPSCVLCPFQASFISIRPLKPRDARLRFIEDEM